MNHLYCCLCYGLLHSLLWLPCLQVTAAEPELTDPSLSQYQVYADVKTTFFTDLRPRDNAIRNEISEVLTRLGIRYNRLFMQDWFFDSDVRVIFACDDIVNPGTNLCDQQLEIKRLYIRTDRLFELPFLALTVGRTKMRDQRAWLYDDDIDVISGRYDSTLLDLEVGLARYLLNTQFFGDALLDADQNNAIDASDSQYAYASAEYQWYYRHFIRMQLVYEDFDNPNQQVIANPNESDDINDNSQLTWWVLSFNGQYKPQSAPVLDYWLDLATVRGQRELRLNGQRIRQKVTGNVGLDLGFIIWFNQQQAALGFQFAHASGDGALDTNYTGYLQAQIATNKNRRIGHLQQRYYGETLDPLLSNLNIISVYGGTRLFERLWLHLNYYHYRQSQADPFFQAANTRFAPNGRSKSIGQALDFALSAEITPDSRVEWILGVFDAGHAFDGISAGKTAYSGRLEFKARW